MGIGRRKSGNFKFPVHGSQFSRLKPGGIFLFTYHAGEKTIHLEEFIGRKVDIEVVFFASDFIIDCLRGAGFEIIEITERGPYPEIEYQSRRAYVFASKPPVLTCRR
ncbi:MAG: hypothetical protein PHG91_07815 [Syntrophales bacterium]|nr:hypothetical protein [Syntrophales bacterium]MDD5233287.1 hypothetical protein [Syntrophales bacterium]MDD5533925.1 hypothetical protein [Syntrophales bacterium]